MYPQVRCENVWIPCGSLAQVRARMGALPHCRDARQRHMLSIALSVVDGLPVARVVVQRPVGVVQALRQGPWHRTGQRRPPTTVQ